MPFKLKDAHLACLMDKLPGNSTIMFTRTCADCMKLSELLKQLGYASIALHGQLPMNKRLSALSRFKTGTKAVLVATDVASRGLDIPTVDCVINYDVPQSSKDYVHRVGRTARAGRGGIAVTLVTQYDVELVQRIEGVLDRKLEEWPVDRESVINIAEHVSELKAKVHREITIQEGESKTKSKGGPKGRKRSNK